MVLEAAEPLFDTRISLDSLLTVGGMIVFITLYVSNMKGVSKSLGMRLSFIDKGMEEFKIELKRLNEVITNQALQSQRIQILDERMMAGGKRVDEITNRLNAFLDAHK